MKYCKAHLDIWKMHYINIYFIIIIIIIIIIYENVFLKHYFCARKGKCEVNHIKHVVVFCKQTAKGAISKRSL